jgi:hypothetical protein
MRDLLGPETAGLRQAGRLMSLEEAVAYALMKAKPIDIT